MWSLRMKTSALYAVVLAITVPTLFAEARLFAQFEMPLQPPWRDTDIGDVGLAGSASETRDGDLIVNGACSDIWVTADSFHCVYQPIDDGEVANPPSLDLVTSHVRGELTTATFEQASR
jgi:hypothetical protein